MGNDILPCVLASPQKREEGERGEGGMHEREKKQTNKQTRQETKAKETRKSTFKSGANMSLRPLRNLNPC